MAAVLGLDDPVLAEICAEASEAGVVVVANANCPGQTVLSGEVGPLERAMELARERGAKRIARLNVSIASHSPLMRDASAAFGRAVAAAPIVDPAVPVVANASAEPLLSADAIREELSVQMERPVRWTESVQTMLAAGVTTFVEVGPGNVLQGLIRRIERGSTTRGVADLGLGLPSLAK
jgi:[acyl-carrier-protein] S-malonyltransferase